MSSTYRVENTNPRVEKQLLRINRKDRSRVAKAILQLEDNPRPFGSIKLTDGIYRLKIGDYRIIYKIFDETRLVFIGKVDRRAEDTYDDFADLF